MGYMHIPNLYKTTTIFLFRECHALEKVHGTSAHIKFFPPPGPAHKGGIVRFSGGVTLKRFAETVPTDEELVPRFIDLDAGYSTVSVYGEAYGGKVMGMKDTYGDKLRFVVFDVRIGESWLAVPQAKDVAEKLGLTFVPYRRIPATPDEVNKERDRHSYLAYRLGVGAGKMREGIVLRPLVEMHTNDGKRVIAKHKREEFAERQHQPKIKQDPTAAMVDAQAIAEEWVTPMRMTHVLDLFDRPHTLQLTGDVIRAMVLDVEREAEGEIVTSRAARRAISSRAAAMFKDYLKGEQP